jgi:c-di-GMP-related signal transduction protein
VRLLQEINQPDLDFDAVELIIKREVALSLKLLRYINSAAIGLRRRIESVKHALLMLGERGVRQWASLVVMADIGSDRPTELMVNAAVRARLCELIAIRGKFRQRRHDLFMLGLFSLVDAAVGRPLTELLKELPIAEDIIAEDIKDALCGRKSELPPVYEAVLGYERGDWQTVQQLVSALGVSEALLPSLFREAVAWGQDIGSLAA